MTSDGWVTGRVECGSPGGKPCAAQPCFIVSAKSVQAERNRSPCLSCYPPLSGVYSSFSQCSLFLGSYLLSSAPSHPCSLGLAVPLRSFLILALIPDSVVMGMHVHSSKSRSPALPLLLSPTPDLSLNALCAHRSALTPLLPPLCCCHQSQGSHFPLRSCWNPPSQFLFPPLFP